MTKPCNRCWLVAPLIVCGACVAHAQYPTVLGYNPGALTSPEVGALEGVQRFGDQLQTDPDPGVGYTYRVFPPVQGRKDLDPETLLWTLVHLPEMAQLKGLYRKIGGLTEKLGTLEYELAELYEPEPVSGFGGFIKQRIGLGIVARAAPPSRAPRAAPPRSTR